MGRRDVITPDEAGTLAGLFRERVRRSGDAEAYRSFNPDSGAWESLSWNAMAARIAHWQAALRREELQPGDRVALMLRNSPEWVQLDIAASGLGLVVVPLYTQDRAENIAYILQNAGVKLLLIGDDEHWDLLGSVRDELGFLRRIVSVRRCSDPGHEPRLQCLDDWLGAAPDTDGPDALHVKPVPADSLATIVYTSGTTGRPKGVMLSHANILWNAHASQRMAAVYTDDLFLSFLPLSHTFERTVGYYLSMMCGAAVAYNRSIPELADDLLEIRPTVLISVPRIFERVYNRIQAQLEEKSPLARALFDTAVDVGWRRFEHRQGRAGWSPVLLAWPLLDALVARKVMQKLGGRMRLAISGGAALPPDISRLFIGLGLNLLQGYGLTETSPVLCASTLEDNVPDSAGLPLPDVEVRLGEGDELLVRSPGVMLGYWDDPQATARMIDSEGWLHTGDKVRVGEDNRVWITGRCKEIIVLSNGEKVPPGDMEMAIAMDPLFDQVLVLGDEHPFLAALIVVNPDQARLELKRLNQDPDAADVLNRDPFRSLALARVHERIKAFPGYARIYEITCYWEPWTIESGLLTPTLKLRRDRVVENAVEDISRMYAGH
ncbi:AMP-dependent synthetase/ligase [Thiohalobacter thiocyanaticus]|uniref:Long-chain fatty acid--CoA ligase n=1 Tax=Thiohalobacter thiocyanaticus TaxID=585455 RepID=A0A426QFQ1_9GAMM|nr:long-chain fatty acid--CoA ligase [Thiohalobacter thiocyanaticus]RRQ20574.1 long-chain fatty acid--CoA ligase [Thiohalobacter thiocyanaticus]